MTTMTTTATRARGERYDVVVAGARVAGASVALHLARAGLRVLVVDPVPEGRDALSTLALMRGGVLQLHRWGLLDELRRSGAPPVTRTVFDYGDEVVALEIEPRDGVDALYAPRRTVLDPILQRAARRAGAEFDFGWGVEDVVRDPRGRVVGVELQGPWRSRRRVGADLVIGADGSRSRVARRVGAATETTTMHATATVYGYVADPETAGAYHWGFRPGLGFGVIPTHHGEACVFTAMAPPRFRARRRVGLGALLEEVLEECAPAMAERVRHAGGARGVRAFAGAPGHLRTPVGPGWALVGDAGYFRDPLTAHGITDALRDAELLARAWVDGGEGGLSGYREARDRAARGLMEVTDRIASLDWTAGEVRDLHRELSREMRVGLRLIESLPPIRGARSEAVTAA